MKKFVLVFLVFVIAAGTFGFSGAGNTVYFSVTYHVDGVKKNIPVDDKSLTPSWWSFESKNNFTGGKTLYERAKGLNIGKNPEALLRENFPELYRIVTKIEKQTFHEKQDGIVNFDPDEMPKFWITGQEQGRELNTRKLCYDILKVLQTGKYAEICAEVKTIRPKSEKEVLSQITLRSQFSTNFEDNTPRECNITLALESFDGLIVERNEIVSFNEIVGRRTRERGYQEAKIIIDGEFVPGVGGGVCQASTTLFNAVLLSGLKIVTSHNHSLPISYVPLGRDAMVSSVSDLKFQNNTGERIYIEAKVIDKGRTNTAQVKIYGKPSDVTYKPRVEVTYGALKTEVKGEVPLSMSGYNFITGESWQYERKVLEKGYPPREAVTYLDTVKDGEVIRTKLIRKSNYKGKPQIIRYERQASTL